MPLRPSMAFRNQHLFLRRNLNQDATPSQNRSYRGLTCETGTASRGCWFQNTAETFATAGPLAIHGPPPTCWAAERAEGKTPEARRRNMA